MSYPECDSYECADCPRRDLCVDYEPLPPLPDVFSPNALSDDSVADAFIGYVDDRINELEEKVEHLLLFEDRIMRILSAVEKNYIGEDER